MRYYIDWTGSGDIEIDHLRAVPAILLCSDLSILAIRLVENSDDEPDHRCPTVYFVCDNGSSQTFEVQREFVISYSAHELTP